MSSNFFITNEAGNEVIDEGAISAAVFSARFTIFISFIGLISLIKLNAHIKQKMGNERNIKIHLGYNVYMCIKVAIPWFIVVEIMKSLAIGGIWGSIAVIYFLVTTGIVLRIMSVIQYQELATK